MKKRVFISYSTRAATPTQPDPDVSTTLDRLVVRLTQAGFEPLVDRKLRSGEQWRYQIYRWIGLCDAAVVLLSRSALQAPWVRKEVELLMWRWDLSKRQSPLIMPFRLGDLQPQEIPNDDEFSATFINELQAPALGDDQLADAAIARLAQLPSTSRETPLRKIESMMTNKLAGLSEADLEDALDALGAESSLFAPEVPDPVVRKRAALAATLLDCSLEQVRDFLVQNGPSLQPGAALFLVDWVASFRVDEAHGTSVHRSSRVKPRELAITSQFPAVGRHYVARGYLEPKPPAVLTPVIRIDEAESDEAEIEATLAQLARAIDPDSIYGTRAQLRQYLKDSKSPRFVALRVGSDHRELRRRLQAEFESITFLFFTRDDQGQSVALAEINTLDVNEQQDTKFRTQYFDALEAAKP